MFEAIGTENPLAATTFACLAAATNIPVTYLMFIDGHAYSAGGIVGTLFTDATIGILACFVAALLLAKFGSTAVHAREESMALPAEES